MRWTEWCQNQERSYKRANSTLSDQGTHYSGYLRIFHISCRSGRVTAESIDSLEDYQEMFDNDDHGNNQEEDYEALCQTLNNSSWLKGTSVATKQQ